MACVIFHPAYRRYDFGPEHPFSPLRLDMVLELLAELGVFFDTVSPEPLALADVAAVHDEEYVRAVETAGAGGDPSRAADFGLGTQDNPIVEHMAEAARWIAGGTVAGAERIASGEAEVVLQLGGGFHHARRRLASGFCLYNDIALAIRRLTRRGLRVAYIDIDVHHGDGVQEILYSDEHVLTLSLHESGEYLFPGSGWIHELGQGMGRGLKLNVPLEPFTEGSSYLRVLEEVGDSALRYFQPDVLVVQAGADAHFLDPLADLMLTTRDFERAFRILLALARQHAKGHVLFTLGGGYSFDAAPRVWTILALILLGREIPDQIPESWRARWQARLGQPLPRALHDPEEEAFPSIPRRAEIEQQNRAQVERLMDAVARLWW